MRQFRRGTFPALLITLLQDSEIGGVSRDAQGKLTVTERLSLPLFLKDYLTSGSRQGQNGVFGAVGQGQTEGTKSPGTRLTPSGEMGRRDLPSCWGESQGADRAQLKPLLIKKAERGSAAESSSPRSHLLP